MDERQLRRALLTLQKVYEDLTRRTVETVLENEEGLQQSPYSFAYQELEARFAPQLINLGHMIGALQQMGGKRKRSPPQYRVKRVEGELEELDGLINGHLDESPGELLHDIALAHDPSGTWHAFLTLSRPT